MVTSKLKQQEVRAFLFLDERQAGIMRDLLTTLSPVQSGDNPLINPNQIQEIPWLSKVWMTYILWTSEIGALIWQLMCWLGGICNRHIQHRKHNSQNEYRGVKHQKLRDNTKGWICTFPPVLGFLSICTLV